MSCLRCAKRVKTDAPCGAYGRGDVPAKKRFDTSGKSLASVHHRKIFKSSRREAGRGLFQSEGREARKVPCLGEYLPVRCCPRSLVLVVPLLQKNPETSCAGDGHVYNAGKIHWRPEVCRADGPRLPERRLLVTLLAGCAMLRWKAGGADARV